MADFFSEYGLMLLTETGATLAMALISTLIAYIVGIPLGVLVTITSDHSILPCRPVNMILGWIVNMGRSIPFIILLVALMPFTRMIVGSAVGIRGVIVPLSIAAIPFVARMIETALAEIDGGLIEVAHATGIYRMADHLEGSAAGEYPVYSDGRSDHSDHAGGIFRYGRRRRRRRLGGCSTAFRLLSL